MCLRLFTDGLHMRIQDIIAAKRDGKELAREDISRIVLDYAAGNLPDYQMSAFLMAAFIQGLSLREISDMTRAMVESGATLDLSSISGVMVDKHSTGGVGDKTTLVVVPILAACGLSVPKMSGRGLDFTGGTLDKFESIPGLTTALSVERFVSQVKTVGAAIAGQTQDIVPADKKIYALRDATGTVGSIPLIAASVMSKKIACSSDVILLDVKVGSGAFMRDIGSARELARTMIEIGKSFGRKVTAAITDMSQPLGNAVGNALEVVEAIETLNGRGPGDLRELCVEPAGLILYMSERNTSVAAGRGAAACAVDDGSALSKLVEIIEAQEGDVRVVDDLSVLPGAELVHSVASGESGWVAGIDAARVGMAASILGAGRKKKEDSIDPAVGVVVRKKVGDRVEEGETLAVLHANDAGLIPQAGSMLLDAYGIGGRTESRTLVHEVISS